MVIVILLVLGLCLGSFVNAYVWRLHGQEELRERIDDLEYEQARKAEAAGKTAKAAPAATSTATTLSASSNADKEIAKHRAAIRDLSIWRGRSRCTHCDHELSGLDLVPVMSYLTLGRKCRYCKKPIDDTPVAELLTPFLFVLSYIFWPQDLRGVGLTSFVFWLVFLVGFVALIIYDARWKILPNRIVLPLIGLAVLQIIIQTIVYDSGDSVAARAFWGVLAASGIFRLLYELSAYLTSAGKIPGPWIGFGDVRLGVLLGLLVGGPGNGLLLLFIASLLGTLVSIPLMMTGRADRRTHIPYGPFLIGAAIIVTLWGAGLISWYGGLVIT